MPASWLDVTRFVIVYLCLLGDFLIKVHQAAAGVCLCADAAAGPPPSLRIPLLLHRNCQVCLWASALHGEWNWARCQHSSFDNVTRSAGIAPIQQLTQEAPGAVSHAASSMQALVATKKATIQQGQHTPADICSASATRRCHGARMRDWVHTDHGKTQVTQGPCPPFRTT